MAKIDFLFQLIKSMDKNEKRFFKLYSTLYNSKKGLYYVILFDILDKMEDFDNEEVEQKLKEQGVPINLFALIKRYLKVQILECLSIYHRNNMNTIKFFNTIGQATILREKRHYPQALKLLASLQKRLEEIEQFDVTIYTLALINSMLELQNNKDVDILEKKAANYVLMEEKAQLLQEFIHIQGIHNEMCQIIYRPIGIDNNRSEALKQLFNNKLAKIQFENIKGIKAKHCYLQTYNTIKNYIDIDFLGHKNIWEQMKEILDSNKKVFSRKDFFVTACNLSGHYLNVKDKVKFHGCIKEMEDIIALSNNNTATYLFYWKCIRLGEFYSTFLEETMPKNLKKEMLDFLEIPNVTYEHKAGIIYRLAAYHFLRKEYTKGREILEQIFLTTNIKAEVSYFLPIRVIYILSLSELKEFHFAEKELVSLKRKMKRDKTNSLLIDKLFFSLTNLIKETIDAQKRQHHLKELVALREYEATYTFFIKKMFVILEWAELEVKN